MADEATIRVSLQVTKNNISYQSAPTGFQTDVSGSKGPCVGAITVSPAGTDVDLSQLTVPGWAFVQNLEVDGGNYVEIGIKEPENGRFYPLMELLAGECVVIKLSRNVKQEYQGTGTGTSAPTNTLHVKANGGSVNVLFQIFEA